MSLRLVTPFVNTNIPGAYPNVVVQSQPVGLGLSGIVVIMGEADGGPGYNQTTLSSRVFTPDQLALVQQQYIGGQIVDSFMALAAPSADPNITGSANLIYIAKTNNGTHASAELFEGVGIYGSLSDPNWGTNGNLYSYQIVSVDSESPPTCTGITIPAFGAPLNGASFTIRTDGSAAVVITLSNTATDHDTIGHLVTELNGLFPVGVNGLVASAAVSPTNALTITMNVDSNILIRPIGRDFELYDSTPGDLASLGLTAGLYVSAQEPVIEVNITRPDLNINQSIEVSADIALEIGYQGTTAQWSNDGTTFTTTVSGGIGANLSIPINQFSTIAELVTYIASQPGYSSSNPASSQQLSPSTLDQGTKFMCSSGAGLLPGRIKRSWYNFNQAISTSALTFSGILGTGLPNLTASPAFLTGGTRGATLAADIINVLNQIAGITCNIIVPLFSEDASLDIIAGLTDPASTYTIAAVNAATKSHCIQYSTPELKKNRICILSFLGTYTNAAAQAQSLGNYRCSLTMQQITQVNSQGAIQTYQPWYASSLAAGMQTGGFYKSILNKAANIVSFIDPSGFDSGSPGDVEQALSAGLLFLSKDTGRAGYWVSDQTTYGFDTNFVYNSIQAVYASDLIALDLAQSFFTQFVGQSLADVSAASALSFLTQKMDGYLKLKLIGSSNDAPLGFKNPSITINAPEMDVAVEIKLATAIYFIPININVSQITGSAGV